MSPFKKPTFSSVDAIDMIFGQVRVNSIKLDPLDKPVILRDLCPPKGIIADLRASFDAPPVDDLTAWLFGLPSFPGIESFPVEFKLPRRRGKAYAEIFDPKEKAIDRVDKEPSRTSSERLRKDRETRHVTVDLFDMILPILQPPLGENRDNTIAFRSGQELYPFQWQGVKFLCETEGALLGDEMGLGKSIQAIVAMRLLFRLGKILRVLVVCPKSVLRDWEVKFRHWTEGLKVTRISGPKEQRHLAWRSPAHVYLVTYETLRNDVLGSTLESGYFAPTLSSWKGDAPGQTLSGASEWNFDLVIMDEAQKIKNPVADVSRAVGCMKSDFRWALTGTPLETKIEDLISIFNQIRPGLLVAGDAYRPLRVKELIRPYTLRRRISDTDLRLPPLFSSVVWLDLLPAQREAYDKAYREGVVYIREMGREAPIEHALALLTKLKQICNLDPESGESCKLEHLNEQLLEIVEQGHKTLVFSQYPEKTLRFLEPKLGEFGVAMFEGSMSDRERESLIAKFQNEDDLRVLLVSLMAGGKGITLTRANYVFHYDLWWNPAVTKQAVGRVVRIGQKKTVFEYTLLTLGTVEEGIHKIAEDRQDLFDKVIDDLSDVAAKGLTKEELFGILGIDGTGKGSDKPSAQESAPSTQGLDEMSPTDFEALIGMLYEQMGYSVKVTQRSRDEGVDVYATRVMDSGTERLAIQCKHYPNGTVGVEHARSLYGVIHDQPDITRGVLITTGMFSRDCQDFVSDKRIDLVPRPQLMGLLAKYQLDELLPETPISHIQQSKPKRGPEGRLSS